MKTESRGSWLRKTFRFGCFTYSSNSMTNYEITLTGFQHLESLGLGLGEALEEAGSVHGGCLGLPLPLRQGLARPLCERSHQTVFHQPIHSLPRSICSDQLVVIQLVVSRPIVLRCAILVPPERLGAARQGAVAAVFGIDSSAAICDSTEQSSFIPYGSSKPQHNKLQHFGTCDFFHIKISTGHVAQSVEPRPALCNASDPILSPVAQNAGSSPVMAKHFVIWFLLEVLQMSAGVTQFFNLRTFC